MTKTLRIRVYEILITYMVVNRGIKKKKCLYIINKKVPFIIKGSEKYTRCSSKY